MSVCLRHGHIARWYEHGVRYCPVCFGEAIAHADREWLLHRLRRLGR